MIGIANKLSRYLSKKGYVRFRAFCINWCKKNSTTQVMKTGESSTVIAGFYSAAKNTNSSMIKITGEKAIRINTATAL